MKHLKSQLFSFNAIIIKEPQKSLKNSSMGPLCQKHGWKLGYTDMRVFRIIQSLKPLKKSLVALHLTTYTHSI